MYQIKKRRLTVILLAVMLLGVLIFSPTVSARERKNVGLHEIYSAMQLIREDYVKETDPHKLLDGARKGMMGYLRLKKMKLVRVDFQVDPTRSVEANLRKFGASFGKAMMYNSRLNKEELTYASLKGMMGVLQDEYKDPYSVAMDSKEFSNLEEQLNSKDFTGIGIYLNIDKAHGNALMVVDPFDGSPAKKAGLKSGDLIVRINGVSTKGMSLDSASNRIRGPRKTPVILHIKRKGAAKTFDVRVIRDVIHVNSLTYKMIDQVGYVKLRSFGETTSQEFNDAIEDLKKKNVQAVILDLRNNGGGYVMSAVDVCSYFLNKDQVVTSVVNYRNETKDTYKAVPVGKLQVPLVILANRHSASASELLAGSIQDNQVGIVVGEKTFGKGSVQTIHRLPGGGAIKFTTAHYLTPSGKDINHRGIIPDVVIKMDTNLIGTDRDVQLRKALNSIKAKISHN